MIRVYIKEPGNDVYEKYVENSLEEMQSIVGGYIETVTIATDLVVICNEEGRMMGLPYNCNLLGMDFVGTIIFAGVDGDKFGDVPEGVGIVLEAIK